METKMKHAYTALVSAGVSDGMIQRLSAGHDVIVLPACRTLAAPVASHPDMLLSLFGGRLITSGNYYTQVAEQINRAAEAGRLKVVLSEQALSAEYPMNILLNVLICSGYLFARTDHTAQEILTAAAQDQICPVYIRQGYSACSALVLGDALITSDPSVGEAAARRGISILSITSGHIRLPGYSTGFIGGASGVSGETVYFYGSPDEHPDGGRIKAFLAARGFRYVSLSQEPLCDFGGIKFIRNFQA